MGGWRNTGTGNRVARQAFRERLRECPGKDRSRFDGAPRRAQRQGAIP